MSDKGKRPEGKGGESMTTPTTINPNNISLSEFIKRNSKKIHAITPKNPSIPKDDEWRDEDFWDDLLKEKSEGDNSQK